MSLAMTTAGYEQEAAILEDEDAAMESLQNRRSQLPLFDHVRAMLRGSAQSDAIRPTPLSSSSDRPRWDPYTGERSDEGQFSHIQPSTYASPYEVLSAYVPASDGLSTVAESPISPSRRQASLSRPSSPISTLLDEAVDEHRRHPDEWSPVSSMHQGDFDFTMIPHPLTPRAALPLQPQTPTSINIKKQIKRKPAPGSAVKSENIPPSDDSPASFKEAEEHLDHSLVADREEPPLPHPTSRFSWTTCTPSSVSGRRSLETNRMSMDNAMVTPPRKQVPKSRFSWSTVNTTTATTTIFPDRPPSPSAPALPPLPDQYAALRTNLPMQSILSRSRPIQRVDREPWQPQLRQRKASLPLATFTTSDATHHGRRSASLDQTSGSSPSTLSPEGDTASTPTATGPSKALPLPPSLTPSAAAHLSHMDLLIKREQDLALQRRNIEKAIAELERLEVASPLAVSWNSVRVARDRLQRNRARLAEIQWELREVGVAISRARRKEGMEEGLWVRRVTR